MPTRKQSAKLNDEVFMSEYVVQVYGLCYNINYEKAREALMSMVVKEQEKWRVIATHVATLIASKPVALVSNT
jgi:hypothetical protein